MTRVHIRMPQGQKTVMERGGRRRMQCLQLYSWEYSEELYNCHRKMGRYRIDKGYSMWRRVLCDAIF